MNLGGFIMELLSTVFVFLLMSGGSLAQNLVYSDIRLVGGTGEHEGRVEILKDGEWGTVCDENWGRQEAYAVCYAHGYRGSAGSSAIAKRSAYFGQGTGPILFDDVICYNTYLPNCQHACNVRGICDHSKDAGVICPLSVRLIGGSDTHEGRLEVLYKGQYGTVCDSGWGTKEAAVVCKNLGFSPEGAQIKPGSHFGKGTGNIWMDKVKCTGSESGLEECSHADLETVSCNHDQEIGIICKPTTIRLTRGTGTFDGRVEVFNNNQWGSVCYTNAGLYDARSVCLEMGIYRLSSNIEYSAKSKPSTTGIPTMLGNLQCGYGQPLQLCPGFCWNERDCTQELFVDCGLDIRLVDGSGPHEGRLEVYYKRQWGTVCDANIGPNEANVICRNLGFQGDGATVRGKAYFGAGTGKVAVDGITCQGSETELAKCQFNGLGKASCGHNNDVSIICKPTKYRLVGGRTESEGRVEVLVNGIWGTVCDKNWGNIHAKILCEELGFPGTRAVSYGGAYFGEGSGKIWLDNVDCSGNEETISTCKHSDWGVTNCKHNGDVSVLCRPSVRLVRGQAANQGRLEYFRNTYNGVNSWGTVCDRGFGTEEAEVVCRELEFPTDGAVAKAGAFYGEGTGPIYLSDVVCNGAEPTLTTCQSNYGYYCEHTEDVSVICPGDIILYVNPVVNVQVKKHDIDTRKMFQFYCDFSKVDKSLFYKSVWYINEAVVHQSQIIKGDNTNLREALSVTEDTLNRKVGYDIMCKIEVRENPTTVATVSSSKSRFIGIKVKTPTLRLRDGEVGQIRIQATAEIGCYYETGCYYSVSALIPDSNGQTATINNQCSVNIMENGWDKEYSIQVKADITQSYQDYSRQFEITLFTHAYHDHKTWSEYTLIDKVTVIVERDPKPIRSLVCKAYCDPRLHTFHGLNINLNYLGTYTLYYDRENDIEVQIQTAPCATNGYCNCGMIARVGGTAYMINKCSSQNWIMEYVMCDVGVSVLKVEKHSDIQITFPTGTYVKAQLISGNPPRFLNVHVYPSILDVELPRGLCGKITENEDHHLVMRNNDVTSDAINYNTNSFQDAETFVSSWRVGKAKNLFDGDVRNNLQTEGTRTTVTCSCTSENGQKSDTLKCDAKSPVNVLKTNSKYKAASTRSCKIATQSFQRKRRSVTNYVRHEHSRIKRTAQWTNGWTEQTAKQHCLAKFTESAMIQICQKHVPSFNHTDALEACKEDIKLLGNAEFVLAAVESSKDFCLYEVYSDPILQSPPPSNNESSVFDEVTKEDCSEECKDHGSCVDGTCVCSAGYAGIDCNINTNLPPKADELEFNGLCDLKTSNYSDIALFGEIFTNQVDMKCKVSQLQISKNGDITSVSDPRIFSADVESLSEVVCPLPSLIDSDESTPEQQQTFTAFNLSVSYNGVDYSNQLSMVVFNSDCMNCSNTNGVIACSINPDFCVTNNRCYKVNETYPLNDQYICTANSEGARWHRNGIDPNSPCAAGNHIPLPNAKLRSPQNNVSSSAVNDLYLIEGWYGQVGKIIPYGTSPEGNACGARFPIYLQSQPSQTTSEEQYLKACLRRYNDPCIEQVDVKAMYCGDDLFVYYLQRSPVPSYGYCLVDSNPAL